MQDPETHLRDLGIRLAGTVNPHREAVLTADHRSVVNGQLFYFANVEGRRLFESAPHRFTGLLLDPETGEWFQPNETSPQRRVDGELFYLASAGDSSSDS